MTGGYRYEDVEQIGDVDVIPPGHEDYRQPTDALLQLVNNPGMLRDSLNISEAQAQNVRALISGAGSAAGVKYLERLFGTELASAMGALAGGFLAKRLMGG